jgi:hypothetical protein
MVVTRVVAHASSDGRKISTAEQAHCAFFLERISPDLGKEKLWQEIADRASRITDNLGMPIDQGILDTVIVLNALGITTKQSCEGHVDRAVCAPWIFFTTPGIEELNKQIFHAQEEAMQSSKARKYTYADLFELFEPVHQLRSVADCKHAEDQQKVLSLLDAFYGHRYVSQYKKKVFMGILLNIIIFSAIEVFV